MRTTSTQKTAAVPTPTVTPEPVRFLGVALHPSMTQALDASPDGPCGGILFSGPGEVGDVFMSALKKNSACFTVADASDAFPAAYRQLLAADGWTLTDGELTGIMGARGWAAVGTRKQGTERMALGYSNGAVFIAVLPPS